jgi:hypothetical protein
MLNRRTLLASAGATLISAPAVLRAQSTPAKKLRIVVVANVYHEADGLMAALCNQMVRTPNVSAPYNIDWPRWQRNPSNPLAPPPDSGKPRCLVDVFKVPTDTTPAATVEIWCIDDLANTNGNSAAKVTAMEQITNYTNPPSTPDGVVAFGTGGYPDIASNDGCATIGSTIFMHDASNGAPGSWTWSSHMDTLVPSTTPAAFFSNVAADQEVLEEVINSGMLVPQYRPASTLRLIIAADAVAVSSVNEPPPYCAADTNSILLARAKGATNITSVETTHGVIRSMWPDNNPPFIYVTAIPNRVCHFPDEAQSIYAQEFPASHNAGVALKNVIPYFVSAISQ